MNSSHNSELQMLSTLQHIAKITRDISTQPRFMEYLTDDSAAGLQALMTSTLGGLINWMNVINARAPISILPRDVLSLVLHEVHYDEIQTSRQPLSRARLKNLPTRHFQSPLLLLRVSRSWYDVIINSPLLWTTVEILPSWNLSPINIFLARSKSCPIFLNIIAELPDSQDTDRPSYRIDELCNALVPHISRCRSIFIRIDAHFTSLLDALHVHLRNQAAPLLEWLFLQIPNISLGNLPLPSPILTLGAPMLSFIYLSRTGMLCWSPPFHHLTVLHLNVDDVELAQCLPVISQCPLLEILAMYGRLQADMEVEPLVLPYLRSLELCGDMGAVADVLLAISAPSLESLVITPFTTIDLERLHNQEGLGPKRYAILKSLTLVPYPEDLDESLQLASACFPHVVDVTLIGRSPHLLLESLKRVDGAIIFPNMRSLALRDVDFSLQEVENAFCSLVAFRSSRDRPLHTLYLDRASMQQMSSLRQFQDAVEVVELDKWSILRRGSPFCDENDETFYPKV